MYLRSVYDHYRNREKPADRDDLPDSARLFIQLLLLASVGVLVLLYQSGHAVFNWPQFLFFAVIIFLAENFCIDLPKAGAVSVTFTLLLAAVILFGPGMPAVAAIFAAIIWRDIKNETILYRRLFNGAQYVLATGCAGLVYVATGGPILATLDRGFIAEDFPGTLVPLSLAITVFFLLNTVLVSTVIGLVEDMSPLNVWIVNVRWAMPNYFALAPLGLAIAHINMTAGHIGVILILLPLLVARQTFQIFMRLRNVYLDTVKSLITALEAKDQCTRGHSERVAELAERVGQELRLSEDHLETLRFAGILHDIGKIGTARYVLRKPGKLTEDEYQKIKLHPEWGAVILMEIKFLRRVVPVIFHHHEHYDGTGYIDGAKGEEIPLLARVLTVVDAYDSMTSPRPYREAMPVEEACHELKRCAGGQFDPQIVDALLGVLSFQEYTLETVKNPMALDETTA